MTSSGEKPAKRFVAATGASKGNLTVAEPSGEAMRREIFPAVAFVGMCRSRKRNEPLVLARTLATRKFAGAETSALARFVPESSRRTGLTVWPVHHEGGSTLKTSGAAAKT